MTSYAACTAPAGLRVLRSRVSGRGVFAVRVVEKGEILGQYTGAVSNDPDHVGPYVLAYVDNGFFHYSVDSSEDPCSRRCRTIELDTPAGVLSFTPKEQKPNWTRFINSVAPSRTDGTRVAPGHRNRINVAFALGPDHKLYVCATRTICASVGSPKELLAWYGSDYWE